MSYHIGYRLIATNGTVAQSWGGSFDGPPVLPSTLVLPDGSAFSPPQVGADYGGYRFERWMSDDNPSHDVLAKYAAFKRYAVETGGTVWNGFIIQTDRDSQSKLIAEFVAMSAGLRPDPSPWKFANGFANVSNVDMQTVILQARTHIASAFAAEQAVVAGVGNGTITSIQQIDSAAWPSNS